MSQTFRLGVFIVLTLTVLAVGVFLIGSRQFMFSSTYKLEAEFESVAGLGAGAEVRVGGINKGTVKEITLPDGRRVTPDEVLGPIQKGVKVVITGDAGRTDDILEACRDADALVIESTYLEEETEMARQFSHLTARQAAELAVKAGVKKLIITHISRRYRQKDVLKEAQAIFPNTVVARDFDSFQIKREE